MMDAFLGKNTPLLTRPYLESLTTHELIRLADSFGVAIPPDLERLFIIAEIMDVTAEYTRNEAALVVPLVETDIPEPVPLPKQYNITFIEVLIRDPFWVFAFWEIKNADKESYEKSGDFKGYQLKVSSADASQKAHGEGAFSISVGVSDTAWYLSFPPGCERFKLELCVLRGGDELVLAV
ncbi:MAG: DUF4912 domain-containing protein, partial [Spirochaetaceae bacterium]|nr:DUF4912 domain-containing protein [Spirochaetaceae bacterium]